MKVTGVPRAPLAVATPESQSKVLLADELPDRLLDVERLEELMTRPSQMLIDDLARIAGDILVLGAAGKMGPTLAALAKRAAPDKRILAVARFSNPAVRRKLEDWGVETIACDLLNREQIGALPKLPNLIYMAGRKFGERDSLDLTWAMNVFVPALVAEAFAGSRIVVFSTGCVYPFVSVNHLVRYIERVVAMVTRQCVDHCFAPQLCSLNVPVALSEALSNAILRGNAQDRHKHVHLSVKLDDEQLVLEIADEGVGFEIETSMSDPTLPENLLREDGRGLFLMHTLMDSVERFNEGGNVVRLTLKRG